METKDIRIQVLSEFNIFMSREGNFVSPRLVAFYTKISHETIRQFLFEKKTPGVIHAARLITFMEMVGKIDKLWNKTIDGWEEVSHPQARSMVIFRMKKELAKEGIEFDLPEFRAILDSPHAADKKRKLLTALVLKEKKRAREEKRERNELREKFEEFKTGKEEGKKTLEMREKEEK